LELAGYGLWSGIAIVIGVIAYDALNLCLTDPTTPVALTAAEANAVLQLQFGTDFTNGLGKIKDLVLALLWDEFCQCNGGVTATTTPTIAPPSGVIVVNATGTCGVVSTPQYSFTTDGTTAGAEFVLVGGQQFQGNRFDQLTGVICNWSLPLPAGCTQVQITARVISIDPTPSFHISYQANFCTSSGTNAGSVPIAGLSNNTTGVTTATVTVPSGGVALTLQANNSNSVNSGLHAVIQCDVSFFCGSAPGAPSGCCPPDATLSSLVKSIFDQVNLLQRYMLPFAYVVGAAHSGLSGTASFAISSLLGMKVELTTVPAYSGEVIANPNFVFDAGWVSIMTGDGLIVESKITNNPMVWTPRLMQEATTFGYYLRPGFVARFTELEPEVA